MVKNPPASVGDGKIPWRRKWQPTPVFLPRKSHGQMSLAGYRPWGHKELDSARKQFIYVSFLDGPRKVGKLMINKFRL